LAENSLDSCSIGQNGCYALQELQKQSVVSFSHLEQVEKFCCKRSDECSEKFKALWLVINEIRSLLWKFTLALAVLQISIQVIFKFLPLN